MIQFFKHATGFCGEFWHPNVWTVFGGSGSFLIFYYVIKNKFKNLRK